MTNHAGGAKAIAVCDRCHEKRPYSALGPDGDKPGLRVCQDNNCRDVKDPYRLPRKKDRPVTLKFPRPDTTLTLPAPTLVDENGNYVIMESGNEILGG